MNWGSAVDAGMILRRFDSDPSAARDNQLAVANVKEEQDAT
jgi:hypothetical protein